ncbi:MULTISPECIES: hypothetical protein [unclassified Streptomyces]|uniref:hypothetical protein n=1 Tax=unclassified Streptomyces TaxID=2593676 RepID=UPI003D8E0BED
MLSATKEEIVDEPRITLFSADLLSKWGFHDGSDPDEWIDYCDNNGLDWAKLDFPLVEVVRRFLLPKLEQNVTVVEIETSHNPIRVETIDGVDVSEYWWLESDSGPKLTPEYVDVPLSEVARIAQELAA